jgi:hypothetical protein
LCAAAVFISCNGTPHGKETQALPADAPQKSFTKAVVPAGLTGTRDRAAYLAVHYWDSFHFGDTSYVDLPEVTEQAFCDYLPVLAYCDSAQLSASVAAVLDRARHEDASGRMHGYFAELFKKYLYDPNSPMRSEELYIPVARHIANDSLADYAQRERAGFSLGMMLKNRTGHKATDFAYYLPSGAKGTLYSVRAEYTLLLFYEPGCPACREAIGLLKGSQVIERLTGQRRLRILSVYAGTDRDAYNKHRGELPASWTDGHDRDGRIESKRLYDLKATPTIYLLDRDKRILLKDTDAATAEKLLAGKVVM